MHQRRAFAERHDQTQQRCRFRCGLLRPVNAGEIRREVHGDAVTEVHEVATATGNHRPQHFLQRTREDLGFVVTEKAAPEDAKFQ